MSGAGGKDLNVSSWGWADFDGQPITRDAAVFRLWSVRDASDGRIAMLLLPVDQSAGEALTVAHGAFMDDVGDATCPCVTGHPDGCYCYVPEGREAE